MASTTCFGKIERVCQSLSVGSWKYIVIAMAICTTGDIQTSGDRSPAVTNICLDSITVATTAVNISEVVSMRQLINRLMTIQTFNARMS
jgi:hypothetical protein